jgi:hypothetical protein
MNYEESTETTTNGRPKYRRVGQHLYRYSPDHEAYLHCYETVLRGRVTVERMVREYEKDECA